MTPRIRNTRPYLFRWFITAAVVLCMLIPLPGLCVCGVCSCDSEEQTSPSTCCQPVSDGVSHLDETEHSGNHYCVCSCTKQTTPPIPAVNPFLYTPLQSLTPPCFALPAADAALPEISVFCTETDETRMSALPVRLHLLLEMLLI